MSTFLTEVRETLAPAQTDRFGPLPPLLVAMTVVTGLVDSFSYLLLGHVFVANMTGNVVFLGFAVAGAQGFSIAASLVALAAFGVGSVLGGRIAVRFGQHRGHHVAVATASQSAAAGRLGDPGRGGHAPLRFRCPLRAHRLPEPRHGCAERQRAPVGRPRPDHHRAHPDGDGNRRGQCARWREGIQVGAASHLGRRHVPRSAARRRPCPPCARCTSSDHRSGHRARRCCREPLDGSLESSLDPRRRLRLCTAWERTLRGNIAPRHRHRRLLSLILRTQPLRGTP